MRGKSSRRTRHAIVGALALILAAATIPLLLSQKSTISPFVSLDQVNEYTQKHFGYSFTDESSVAQPFDVNCADRVPKNPTETVKDQFTVCQNNGIPVKVSLAWKKAELENSAYLNRIANTVMNNTMGSGNFACLEDKAFPTYNFILGTLSDCTITDTKGTKYYYSAFFFRPTLHPEMVQILYVYDSSENSDEEFVKKTIRGLARSLEFESAFPRFDFLSSLFGIETAMASGGGGGGGGDGTAGGECSAGGEGGCAGDGGVGGAGNDSDVCVANFGTSCNTCNSCNSCRSGTIQCEGACSATAPDMPSYDDKWCQDIGWDFMTDQCLGYCDCRAGRGYVDPTPGDGRGGSCQPLPVSTPAPVTPAPTPVVTPAAPVNGLCASNHYNCIQGTPISTTTYSTGWGWECQGRNGGTSSGCFESNGTVLPAPTVTLTVNGRSSVTVAPGEALNLAWTTTNSESCTASAFQSAPSLNSVFTFSGSKSVPAGAERISASMTNGTFFYRLKCYSVNGARSDTDQVTVNVVSTPAAPVVDLKINGSDADIEVNENDDLNITWTSTNADVCSGLGYGWAGLNKESQGDDLISATQSANYEITCSGPGGTSNTDDVYVTMVCKPTEGAPGLCDCATETKDRTDRLRNCSYLPLKVSCSQEEKTACRKFNWREIAP